MICIVVIIDSGLNLTVSGIYVFVPYEELLKPYLDLVADWGTEKQSNCRINQIQVLFDECVHVFMQGN